MRLGHPAHVAEMGLAAVAEARVDPGQVDGHRVRRSSLGSFTRGTIRPFKVGGDGKPVRIRRGPATVIGDAGGTQPLARTTRREGAAGRPVSQETRRRPPSRYALVERGGPHEEGRTRSLKHGGARAAPSRCRCRARLAGLGRTGRDGADQDAHQDAARPQRRCTARRAGSPREERRTASAPATARPARSTRRRTASGAGKYFASVGGIFVTSILGVRPKRLGLLGALRQRQELEPRRLPGQAARRRAAPVQDHLVTLEGCGHGDGDRGCGRHRRLRPRARAGDLERNAHRDAELRGVPR